MNFLLVAGGDVDYELLKKIWKDLKDPFTVGVDRGCIYLLDNNIPIGKAIGDFDSVNEAEREIIDRFFDVEALETEKDDTDTEHALRFILSEKPDKVIMMGCTGTRLDQTLASIYMLKLAKDAGVEAYIIDSNNRIRVERGITILSKKDMYGRYISILPYGENIKGLKLRGFKYDTKGLDIDAAMSRGISNELTHDAGMISCDDYYIVMETKD